MTAGFEVKGQHRIAGRFRQPHRPGLCDARRPARSVEGEPDGLARRHVARELQQRLARPARRRAARRFVSEALDDPRDPLAVEVLAGDDDDAAAAEEVGGRQNTAVPEGHHRLASAPRDRVEMRQPLRPPFQRRSQRRDDDSRGRQNNR